ncbi:unnamed protein product [Meganyctiphanes norvegica]|uniref:Uncharacterized protein n=1 Tax=Meganyctiphanes norvegica TaxID=48144 RepID=A0AAV2RLP7_MEGNR
MRWTIVVICALVAVLVTQVSAIFFPIVTSTGTTAATTTSLTVGTGGLAVGGLALAGIIGLGLAAALLAGGEEEPSYGYHQQSYHKPQPSYHKPQPSYHAPAPSYHAPAPSYKAPAPSYKAPAPSYKAPAPSYKAPAPSYHAPAPSYKAPAHKAPAHKAPAPSHHAPATSSYGHHRRGRSVEELESKASELFSMVAQVDTYGCGMRLVCQVFQKNLDDLSPRERVIKKFIGEKPAPVPENKINEPKARYVSAAILGERNDDCYKIYEACPLSDDDVKAYLLNLETNLVGDA